MNTNHVEIDLQRIDMNLLVAFDALARECSVTKAARPSIFLVVVSNETPY